MSNINGVMARVFVPDLDSAILERLPPVGAALEGAGGQVLEEQTG